MKILFFFALIVTHVTLCLADMNVEDIPHYKIYPRTPLADYKAAILDFYSVKNPYGEFSNFALFPITIENSIWPSSEHFYQAQKFLDPELKEKVRNAGTPFLAAQIGRDPNLPMRDDWDNVKDGIMLIALRAKFSQYKILHDLLLSTNKAHIYEHTKNDCYWADCEDRSGENRLGKELMQVRDELTQASTL